MRAFESAGLKAGDTLKAESIGPGRVVLTRPDDVLDGFSGALRTGGALRGAVDALRDEWG